MFCAAPEAKTKYRSIWDYRRGRVPTQQKNFLSTRAVQKWFAYVVAHCPSLEVLRQSYFLAEEVGGGGLLLNTSSSRYERPLESSLGLRFQAVIRHTPLPPVVHTRRMHSKLFFPPQWRHICAKPATSPAEPPACWGNLSVNELI